MLANPVQVASFTCAPGSLPTRKCFSFFSSCSPRKCVGSFIHWGFITVLGNTPIFVWDASLNFACKSFFSLSLSLSLSFFSGHDTLFLSPHFHLRTFTFSLDWQPHSLPPPRCYLLHCPHVSFFSCLSGYTYQKNGCWVFSCFFRSPRVMRVISYGSPLKPPYPIWQVPSYRHVTRTISLNMLMSGILTSGASDPSFPSTFFS